MAAAEAKVAAAEAKVAEAKREVAEAKRDFKAATDATEKEMLKKDWESARQDWESARQGLKGASDFLRSQQDRLVRLQRASDTGTLSQHSKHSLTHCRTASAPPSLPLALLDDLVAHTLVALLVANPRHCVVCGSSVVGGFASTRRPTLIDCGVVVDMLTAVHTLVLCLSVFCCVHHPCATSHPARA